MYRSQALSRVLSRLHVARPRESVLRCVAGSVSKLLGAVCGQLSLAALEREIGVYWSHFHKRVITLGTAPDAIVCTDVCARSPCKCSSRGYAGRCWCSAGSCGDYVGRCSRPCSPCRRSGCGYAGRCWCLCSSCRRLLWRLCWQTLVPLQSLQMLLWRLCWQMLVPPQSLHWRFRLLCSHFFSTLLGCLPCAPSPAPVAGPHGCLQLFYKCAAVGTKLGSRRRARRCRLQGALRRRRVRAAWRTRRRTATWRCATSASRRARAHAVGLRLPRRCGARARGLPRGQPVHSMRTKGGKCGGSAHT